MAHLHDCGYKFLFSHADLVSELLEVFARPGVNELLNYATLMAPKRPNRVRFKLMWSSQPSRIQEDECDECVRLLLLLKK